MKFKSNPCRLLYYKSCSVIIFVSIKAIQDKITLEIVSINKSNGRVNYKHQITPKTSLTVIFGGFMHHLEPCWNKMLSLRASLLSAPGAGCRVCPSCTCFFTPNLHLLITLLLGMNMVFFTTAIRSTKIAGLPESKKQHFPVRPLCCKSVLWRVPPAAHRHTDTPDHVMPLCTPSSGSSLGSPRATAACVDFPY